MNIGFDASRAFSENSTGTENYSRRLLEEMLSIDTENKYYVYAKIDCENRLDKFSQNINWIRIDKKYLWTQMGLARRTFTDPLDVLFVPAHTLPLVRKPGLSTVMTVHDLGAEYLPTMHQLKQQLYLKFITNYQLQTASHLIAVSQSTRQDLIKKTKVRPSQISVVYEGVNKPVFLPTSVQIAQTLSKLKLNSQQYFLFVGTVQPRKNLIRLIEAFSLFLIESKEKASECKLVIAGGLGWDYGQILNLPKQLGIEKQVLFTGRVSDEELDCLYRGAVCLTYPSLFEGFGLPILEAFARDCPVITSDTSSMPEVAGNGAILVNPDMVEEIFRAMVRIFNDKELSKKLIQHGREQLTKFSWRKAAEETIAILTKAAKKP